MLAWNVLASPGMAREAPELQLVNYGLDGGPPLGEWYETLFARRQELLGQNKAFLK